MVDLECLMKINPLLAVLKSGRAMRDNSLGYYSHYAGYAAVGMRQTNKTLCCRMMVILMPVPAKRDDGMNEEFM